MTYYPYRVTSEMNEQMYRFALEHRSQRHNNSLNLTVYVTKLGGVSNPCWRSMKSVTPNGPVFRRKETVFSHISKQPKLTDFASNGILTDGNKRCLMFVREIVY